MLVVNEFQPVTNVKKNYIFLCSGGLRYHSEDTVKVGKNLKSIDNVLEKIVKKPIFSERKLTNEETHFIFYKDLSFFSDLGMHF